MSYTARQAAGLLNITFYRMIWLIRDGQIQAHKSKKDSWVVKKDYLSWVMRNKRFDY